METAPRGAMQELGSSGSDILGRGRRPRMPLPNSVIWTKGAKRLRGEIPGKRTTRTRTALRQGFLASRRPRRVLGLPPGYRGSLHALPLGRDDNSPTIWIRTPARVQVNLRLILRPEAEQDLGAVTPTHGSLAPDTGSLDRARSAGTLPTGARCESIGADSIRRLNDLIRAASPTQGGESQAFRRRLGGQHHRAQAFLQLANSPVVDKAVSA